MSATIMYETLPDVAALNKVKGFDPLKFLYRTNGAQASFDLKYKKLWFRLAYPSGRIKVTVLRATKQIAIIEAKVFLHKNDVEPTESFIATARLQDRCGALFTETAQYIAVGEALNNAGFGLQFCDVAQGNDPEFYDDGILAADLTLDAQKQGFDCRSYVRPWAPGQAQTERLYLDLKYKRLRFRLAHPMGRIKTVPLMITEQAATIQAMVFLGKEDKEPAATCVAQRTVQDKAGSLYIEAAQYAAVNQALCEAGFGLQLTDAAREPVPAQQDVSAQAATPPQPATPAGEELPVAQESPAVEPAPLPEPPAPPAVEPTSGPVPVKQVPEQPVEDSTASVQTPTAESEHQDVVQPSIQNDEQSAGEVIVGGSKPSLYTNDMSVDAIYALMTPEEAADIISDVGTCAGQTLEQIAQRRIATLKWYCSGYPGDNNILRAGARIMLEQAMGQQQIAS